MGNPFDALRHNLLTRLNTLSGKPFTLEREVNFFVVALENAGAKVRFTCGGHPTGFFVVFDADYELALRVAKCGYFHVSLMRQHGRFRLDLSCNEIDIQQRTGAFTEIDRDSILRSASLAWDDVGLHA